MATYTTKQGDMWDAIAYTQLGSVSYTDKLMNLNQQYREYYCNSRRSLPILFLQCLLGSR